MNKSYWIWCWGEYEIYHSMLVHFRREEREFYRPAVWKVATPYPSARFKKMVNSDSDGYIICHVNGEGSVVIDGKFYRPEQKIELSKGEHKVEVQVCNHKGLPAIFIESDVCPSNGSWLGDHFAGELAPVGYNKHFDEVAKNPEVFPFEYKTVFPIKAEKKTGGILFDFGKEIFGHLNIEKTNKNASMGVYYGESEEEALDVDFTYITEHISGLKRYKLKPRAFRYVYIKNAPKGIKVSAELEYLPLPFLGAFECNDSLFNDVYALSSYTFHLNCREGFFDGLKRDRWIWGGDAYQSARINRYLFFDKEIEQRTLISLVGKPPIEQHVNTILDYSLLWIIALYEHYFTYADKEFLSRIYPSALKLLNFCETRINSDGFIEGTGDDWTFIDWSDIEKDGAVCAEQMLLIKAYLAMSFLAKEMGEKEENDFERKAEELKKRVNEFYWSAEKGAFIDGYKSGKNKVTRHANIFAVMYGISTQEQTASILKNVFKNENVTKITTPYFEGYELDAMAMLGEFDFIEKKLSSYWGGMLEKGATTIWEEYCPDMQGIEHYAMYGGKYEKSLCHAWGAGPIYLFGRYYLGVSATKAGYETFLVQPQAGNLKRFSGVAPINGGTVSVKMDEESLTVCATKDGGTLVWQGKEYPLIKDIPLKIKF